MVAEWHTAACMQQHSRLPDDLHTKAGDLSHTVNRSSLSIIGLGVSSLDDLQAYEELEYVNCSHCLGLDQATVDRFKAHRPEDLK